jgi:hypothetical protein
MHEMSAPRGILGFLRILPALGIVRLVAVGRNAAALAICLTPNRK